MRTTAFSNAFAFASLCGLAFVPIATSAASTFAGPPTWTRTDVHTPTPTRTISQWQLAGDTSTSLTFIQDSSISYAETLTAMFKNFDQNVIKLATNKDVPCVGGTAHDVEFTSGPQGSRTIFNRLVIPEGTGVATITYTRADGNAFDGDVQKAEATFCAGTLDPSTFPAPSAPASPVAASAVAASPAAASPVSATPAASPTPSRK